MVVAAGPNQAVDEGDTIDLFATVNDPNPADGSDFSYRWYVSYGGQIILSDTSAVRWALPTLLSFPAEEDGVYTVTFTATDNDGGGKTYPDTLVVTAANVAPSISSLSGPTSPPGPGEGESQLTATVIDPGGVQDPLSYTWSFGDGSDDAGGVALNTLAHNYADNGTYTVTLTVTDDEGGSATQNLSINVTNVAPIIAELSGDAILAEGQSGAFDRAYTVNLTVADDDGQSASDSTVLIVHNRAPSALTVTAHAAGQTTVHTGVPLEFAGSFTDPGADAWRVEVQTGDGTLVPLDLAGRDFTGRHAYRRRGFFYATVTVTDDEGGRTETTFVVTAVNELPTVDLDADDSSGQIGGRFAATFTEGGAPVAVADADATLGDDDVEDTTLVSLSVTIANRLDGPTEWPRRATRPPTPGSPRPICYWPGTIPATRWVRRGSSSTTTTIATGW